MRKKMKLVFFIAMIFLLIGVSPVIADYVPGNTALKINSVGGSEDLTMFTPTTGYLAVQNEYDSSDNAPYVVNTNLYQIQYTYSQELGIQMTLNPETVSKFTGITSPQAKYGIRNAYLDGVNYIFSNSNEGLNLDSFTLGLDSTGKNWNGYWGPSKDVGYSFIDMDKNNNFFRVVPNATGIYLISKQISNSNLPILDISFLSEDQLLGNNSVITPTIIYEFINNAPSDPTFNPVPDTRLYDVMITNHMVSGDETLIGAVDVNKSIYTWYIGPSGWGQKQAMSPSDVSSNFPEGIESVYFNAGCTQNDESGIDNVSVSAFENTQSTTNATICFRESYICNLSAFSTSPWKRSLYYQGGESYFAGKNPITSLLINLPISGTNNLWSFWLYGCIYQNSKDPYTEGNNLFLNAMPSDRLIYNPNLTNVSVSSDFSDLGNLVVPLGFVDGAPPFALNGYPCDGTTVLSQVQITKGEKGGTQTSGTFQEVGSIGWGHEIKHPEVGFDVSDTLTCEETSTTDTNFNQNYLNGWSSCDYQPHSNGYFVFLGPKMETGYYNFSDMSGNVPADPNTIFITQYQPGVPLTQDAYAYNLTEPDTTGWVAGIRSAPSIFNVGEQWNWTSWSGGWTGRDWTLTNNGNPYLNKYKVYEGEDMEWDEGQYGLPSYEFDQTTGTSFSINNEATASVKLFGFTGSGTFGFTHVATGTTTLTDGITFNWQMHEADDDYCGIKHIIITPQILVPNDGEYDLPWIPSTYREYQPWYLTYTASGVEPSDGCNAAAGALDTGSEIGTGVIPANTGSIILPTGGIPVNTTGRVQAVPASGYTFLHWEGKGIDLDDYNSPVANATVTMHYSTIRAYFAKQSSDLVDTGMIAIQNNSIGNQVKIQGTLPAGFNKYHALNLKTPIEVKIGNLKFPFGPTFGDVTVVSDHQVAYTTTDPRNGVSNLRVDLGTNKWWFAANQVKDLAGLGVNSNIVTVGLGARNISVHDDILMTGKEDISWSGRDEPESNKVFSLQNASMTGDVYYQNDKQDNNFIYLKDGDLKVSSIKATDPLILSINKIKIRFDNATGVNGNVLTYKNTSKDLNATITVNNKTMVWDAVMNGKRLSNNYWNKGVSFSLQIGKNMSSVLIHPNETTYLITPNIASSNLDGAFLSGINFGA